MPRSAIRPDTFWVRRKDVEDEVVTLTIRARWDIKEIDIPGDDMGEARKEWDFKEQEIKLRLDIDDLDTSKEPDAQFLTLVQGRATALLTRAQKKWAIETGDHATKWRRKAVDVAK